MRALVANGGRDMEQLSFSRSDFARYKMRDKEVCIAGSMYDVKSVTVRGDSVILSVVEDKEEHIIRDSILQLVSGDDIDTDFSVSFFDLLTAVYILPGQYVFRFVLLLSPETHAHYASNADAYCHKIISPPPEVIREM